MAKYKFQYAGSTDLFSQLVDQYQQAGESMQAEPEALPTEEPTPEVEDYSPDYEALQGKYDELQSRFNQLSSRLDDLSYGKSVGDDGFMNFLFSDENKDPINWDEVATGNYSSAEGAGTVRSSSGSALSARIAAREGNYGSVSKNSSGTGKYQFLWGTHGGDIQRVTGVKSREEFLRSPEAQERYFHYWDQKVLDPEADKLLSGIRRYYPGITKEQAKMMIHFGGAGNVQKAIQNGTFKKPLDANGTSLHGYVFGKKYQNGGVAATPEQQFTGLNNPAFDKLFFPLKGLNQFRGLDSGEPVFLQDQRGNQKILFGPNDVAKMWGSVNEQRI